MNSKFATKSIGGSGLGLYISKSILEAHKIIFGLIIQKARGRR
ncbi:MAG TPA: hypothetical protein VFG90_10520 [Nitrososphaeraceae archaeon]|nr:hypothetical protein [Nitrososphaeraceae archaeon]